MFTTLLIVFRESLEAALLVGVVAAATRGLAGRGKWLGAGVFMGFLGAIALALLAGRLSEWLDGLGQDVVNIGVLSLALGMLLWHCIWVSAHTREMVSDAKRLGRAVQDGQRTPWALLAVVSLAVLREGAETVLFVSGSLTGNGTMQPGGVLVAGAGGLLLGALVGLVIYAGLTQVPTRYVFAVTNAFIALLAASLASQLVKAFAQAGMLDYWSTPVWDSSWALSQDSALGTFLHALVGYEVRPSASQLGAYAMVLACIYIGTRLVRNRANLNSPSR